MIDINDCGTLVVIVAAVSFACGMIAGWGVTELATLRKRMHP